MNLTNLFKIAFKALGNNKSRCLLTMLGIIIGVASVITMIAIGQGSKVSIRNDISSMGSNTIMIHPKTDMRGGVRQSSSNMTSLKLADYYALERESLYITAITPNFSSSGQAIYAANNTPTTIYGVNEHYLDIQGYSVAWGEMFTSESVDNFSKVCLLGQTVVDDLFGGDGEKAIGATIRFNSIPFTVIGVLNSKGSNSMGMDQDDMIVAPWTSVQKRILAIDYVPSIVASAQSEELSEKAVKNIKAILRQQHNIGPFDDDDFEVRSMEELLSTMSSVMSMLTALLAAIAGISLIVGGIGIMNIMYVSVTERTREIGLRMSIGAKGKYIMYQFLIEAVIISVMGGLIGVVLGVLISNILRFVAGIEAYVQLYSVLLSFGVCTVTGVFFGWYPARKAAALDPIDALRYE